MLCKGCTGCSIIMTTCSYHPTAAGLHHIMRHVINAHVHAKLAALLQCCSAAHSHVCHVLHAGTVDYSFQSRLHAMFFMYCMLVQHLGTAWWN